MAAVALHFSLPDVYWSDVWVRSKQPAHFPPLGKLFQIFPTKDGAFIFTGALTDKQWEGMITEFRADFKATGESGKYIVQQWDNGSHKSIPARIADIHQAWDTVGSVVAKHDLDEFEERAQRAGMIFAKALRREEVLDDPQVRYSKTLQELSHPKFGTYQLPRHAAQFSRTPALASMEWKHAPLPGEHNDEVRRSWLSK